eukprot:maker-scaffold_27-snap-gene-2.53-mRNA-1 protein AED:0.12 eAED:0.12 QI:376/0.66/0.75/1/1/1/4/994/304
MSYRDLTSTSIPVSTLADVKEVVKEMNKFPNNYNKQAQGCKRIWEFGFNKDLKSEMLEHGVGEVLINVLDNFIDNEKIQKVAIAAVKNLDGNLYTFNQKVNVIAIGIGQRIMKIMRNKENSRHIAEYGCHALRTLATSRPNSKSLMREGAGERILRAIHVHRHESGVARAACGAVFSFSLLEDNREKLWKLGLMHFVLQAMQDHQHVEKVQEYGCGAIWTFGYVYSMVRLEAAKRVVTAYHKYPANVRIAEYTCGSIKAFAALGSNGRILLEHDVVPCLMEMIRVHRKRPNTVASGILSAFNKV